MPAIATSRQRLRPAQRLLRRSDFRQTYDRGVRRQSPHFVVFARRQAPSAASSPQPALVATRIGITVPGKVGNAVVRNRIRRRTREIVRRHLDRLAPGWDVVINPRRPVAETSFTQLEGELVELLARLTGAEPGSETGGTRSGGQRARKTRADAATGRNAEPSPPLPQAPEG